MSLWSDCRVHIPVLWDTDPVVYERSLCFVFLALYMNVSNHIGCAVCASSVKSEVKKMRWERYLLSVTVVEKGNTPFLFIVCSLPQLFMFFPLHFSSHLICSSFCWTPLCPSPHPPILSKRSTHVPPFLHILYQPPILPSFSIMFPVQQAEVYHSLGLPGSRRRDKQRAGITIRHALRLHSIGSHVNGVCVFLWSCFSQTPADTFHYSLVSHRHTKDSADKDIKLILPEWESLI